MNANVMKSDEARLKWRDVIETALVGGDTIIVRYNRPTAVVIPFEDYEAILEALEDYRAGRRAEVAHREWQADPATGEDWETVKAKLTSEGLLDSE